MKEKGWFRSIFCAVLTVAAASVLILHSSEAAAGAKYGLSLCAGTVIPAVFPFMALCVFACESPAAPFFSKLLSLPARLFRLPGNCGGILLASLIGGYPSAAKCAGDYYKSGLIDRETAERLLTFCVNAGPPFLLFAVGQAAFGSVRTGAFLWISQLASSVVIGLLGALFAKKPARTSDTGPFSGRSAASSATHAVIAAADACFTMCAFITAACALTELFDAGTLSGLFLKYPVSRVLFDGLFEVTSGCTEAGKLGGMVGILAAAGIASFSGISVILQVAGILEGSGIRLGKFLLSRPIHGALTAAFCWILLRIFPEAVESAVSFDGVTEAAVSASAPAAVSLLCMMALFLVAAVPEREAGKPVFVSLLAKYSKKRHGNPGRTLI
ncbi:MAG TPA: hypothetical protein PLU75_00600 [Oscillospiraceae bacterium]|nr:hypothetical protein [Oscillospiraceae bacterium]HRW56424.1 hypothetical protein [Oscillospiraceae bacterium]